MTDTWTTAQYDEEYFEDCQYDYSILDSDRENAKDYSAMDKTAKWQAVKKTLDAIDDEGYCSRNIEAYVDRQDAEGAYVQTREDFCLIGSDEIEALTGKLRALLVSLM